jgi:hypothetical protein
LAPARTWSRRALDGALRLDDVGRQSAALEVGDLRLGALDGGLGGDDLLRARAGAQLLELQLGGAVGRLRLCDLEVERAGVEPGEHGAGLDLVAELGAHLLEAAGAGQGQPRLAPRHDRAGRRDGRGDGALAGRDRLTRERRGDRAGGDAIVGEVGGRDDDDQAEDEQRELQRPETALGGGLNRRVGGFHILGALLVR